MKQSFLKGLKKYNISCLLLLAEEQKARTTYDNILALVDDEEIKKPIRFLRAREVVHYQRFAEALELVKKRLNSKNYYAFNPSFKNGKCNK
ncbi:MAG: manganese catalase family protein [Thomasclavelia spiroformis]